MGLIGGAGAESMTTTDILLENGDTAQGFNLDYNTLFACAIEERETVTITGGYYSFMTRVTRYTVDGASETLPSLQNGRRNHACGHYTSSSNSIVYIVSGGWVSNSTF